MTKAQLNQYLGQKVRITFFDGDVKEGILGFTKEFSYQYRYRKPNYYTIQNVVFLVSHIKKLEKI